MTTYLLPYREGDQPWAKDIVHIALNVPTKNEVKNLKNPVNVIRYRGVYWIVLHYKTLGREVFQATCYQVIPINKSDKDRINIRINLKSGLTWAYLNEELGHRYIRCKFDKESYEHLSANPGATAASGEHAAAGKKDNLQPRKSRRASAPVG